MKITEVSTITKRLLQGSTVAITHKTNIDRHNVPSGPKWLIHAHPEPRQQHTSLQPTNYFRRKMHQSRAATQLKLALIGSLEEMTIGVAPTARHKTTCANLILEVDLRATVHLSEPT
jgi:hypothetical protein